MGNLAWYYIIQTGSTYLFQGGIYQTYTEGWDTLTWRGCMEYDIGTAIDTPNFSFQSGTDPRGYDYEIKSREYTNALVLCRNRGEWNQDFDDSTAVTVNLGGTYKELQVDGTLGSEVTSIEMINAQGSIMIPSDGNGEEIVKKCLFLKGE